MRHSVPFLPLCGCYLFCRGNLLDTTRDYGDGFSVSLHIMYLLFLWITKKYDVDSKSNKIRIMWIITQLCYTPQSPHHHFPTWGDPSEGQRTPTHGRRYAPPWRSRSPSHWCCSTRKRSYHSSRSLDSQYWLSYFCRIMISCCQTLVDEQAMICHDEWMN